MCEAIPIVGVPFAIWRMSNEAKSAFVGIKAAYNNARYRTLKATQNAIVYTTNA
ncbi:MAG: hypothetical protein WAM28_06450 [Chlamydiales bacterium]